MTQYMTCKAPFKGMYANTTKQGIRINVCSSTISIEQYSYDLLMIMDITCIIAHHT